MQIALRMYINMGRSYTEKVSTSAKFFYPKSSNFSYKTLKMPNAQSVNCDEGVRCQTLSIVEFLESKGEPRGKAVQQTKDYTGVSHQSIYRWKKQARERGFDPAISPLIKLHYVEDKERPGRPTKITPQVEEALLAQVRKDRNSREMTAAQHGHKIGLSPSTVLKAFRKIKLKSCKTTKKPSLTTAMLQERLSWAIKFKDWTLEDWKNVIWSDETSVMLHARRGRVRVWRLANEVYAKTCVRRRWAKNSEFMFWVSEPCLKP